MILASPFAIARALGASASSLDGTGDEGLLNALLLLKSRVEAALCVRSLDLGDYEDTFDGLGSAPGKADFSLLLANAFLTDAPVTVTSTDESGITPTVLGVDKYLGVVKVLRVDGLTSVKVSYTSGFGTAVDTGPDDAVHVDPQFRVAVGAPAFLAEATAQAYVFWRRNTLANPAVTKEYGFLPTLNDATIRSLKGSIYSNYMRPRFGMRFHASHAAV